MSPGLCHVVVERDRGCCPSPGLVAVTERLLVLGHPRRMLGSLVPAAQLPVTAGSPAVVFVEGLMVPTADGLAIESET
jgi:hypothetical protein